MRLIHIEEDGNISLTEFIGCEPPHYAILSHTWDVGCDEFTFQDITSGRGREKVGYKKIQFCGDQAKEDGLEYFWVDTCCIDKSSSAELSESINSMFQWYKNAKVCYALLSDLVPGN